MPWLHSNTVYPATPASYEWRGTNTYNQHCAAIGSIPTNATVRKLRVYAAARTSIVSTRLCLWASGGSILSQSDSFNMAVGTESGGGQFWYEKDVDDYKFVAGGTLWVGLYRNPTGGHIFGRPSSPSADAYQKTNTSGFPSVSSMSGYNTDSGDEVTTGLFYITAPSAPSGAGVTRVSDSQQNVTWTNNNTTDQPYDNIYVERYDNVTASWYVKATLSGSSTSYNDTTTSANRQYTYRVRAYNASGYSSYSTTSAINTTPSPPTNVIASRVGSNVEITWEDNATNETNQTIQRKTSTDGISWTSYSTLSSSIAADSESYTDTSPANYNQYQVRADCTTPTLNSAYTESNEVIVIQAPDEPTNLSPDDLFAIDADDAYTFSWNHNPLDGTAQTKFSLRYKLFAGSYPGTPQYDEVSSTDEFVSITGSTFTNGNTYYWQVKTWGEDSTGSDWSNEAVFLASDTPVATITDPTAISDYGYSSLEVDWTYTQSDSVDQVEYLCRLYDSNDTLLETQNVNSQITSGSSDTAYFDTVLENNSTYTVTLSVKSLAGKWSDEVEVEFDTSFYTPPTPTFTLEADEDTGSINIAITNPSHTPPQVSTDYNRVYRSVDSGDFELIYDNVTIDTTVTDWTAGVGNNNNYYIQAVNTTNDTTKNSIEDDLDLEITGYYFFNSGSNYEDYAKLRGDTSYSDNFGREAKTKKYHGRTYSLEYQGENKSQLISFSCDLPKTEYSNLKSIIEAIGDHFYRDYEGRHFKCSIKNASVQKKDNQGYQFSCNIERLDSNG